MNMKFAIGIALGLAIGALCSFFGIPAPAPPAIVGALVVLAMTVGYELADRFLSKREATSRDLCGGPTGETRGDRP
jgi:XapX domain-containing protein